MRCISPISAGSSTRSTARLETRSGSSTPARRRFRTHIPLTAHSPRRFSPAATSAAPDGPRLRTRHSRAAIAVDARTGGEKWVTQLNAEDVWHYGMRGYDPKTGRYKDQSIGDTPKLYMIDLDGKRVKVVGVGCKNG